MYVLGLTGSIGMGKSATADLFRSYGICVHDADATVHMLMSPTGKATGKIERAFPGSLNESGAVDRQKLGAQVFGDAKALKKLERILHPLVYEEEKKFLRRCRLQGRKLVVLDIPLLFETRGEKRCDGICVVSASGFLQRKRVMARAGMTAQKFDAILQKQMPDTEKRRRADFIIFTGAGFRTARNQVKKIIQNIKG